MLPCVNGRYLVQRLTGIQTRYAHEIVSLESGADPQTATGSAKEPAAICGNSFACRHSPAAPCGHRALRDHLPSCDRS